MTGIDREKQIDKIKAQNSRVNRFAPGGGSANSEVQSVTQKMLNQNFFVTNTKTSEEAIDEAIKLKQQNSAEPDQIKQGKNKNKRNKGKK